MKNKIGVLGGMGPLATTIYLKNVIDYTDAKNDQENVPLTIINDTEIPDRTDYILGLSNNSPFPKLLENVKILENIGCNYIVMICNTSHSFYEELQKNTNATIINMVEETLKECKIKGCKKVGLLATEGTIKSQVYQKYNKFELELVIPPENIQNLINSFIYDHVKKNIDVTMEDFIAVLNFFFNNGCDSVILGCTELSVIYKDLNLQNDSRIIDSTSVIAKLSIKISNKKLKTNTN